MDFGRFGKPKWNQIGTKIESKTGINFEKRFFENRAPALGGSTNFEDLAPSLYLTLP